MSFLLDTFTGTGDVGLNLHTGELGATWTLPDGNNYRVSGGNAYMTASGIFPRAYASGTPSGPNYDVWSDQQIVSGSTNYKGIAGRIATDSITCYAATRGIDAWQLFRVVAAVQTILGTYPDARALPLEALIKLELRDAAKKVYLDDVEIISNPDNAIPAAGRAGLWGRGGTSVTYWHNIEAADAPAGSSFTIDGEATTDIQTSSPSEASLAINGTGTPALLGGGESHGALNAEGITLTDLRTPGAPPLHPTTPGHTWFHYQYALFKLGITDQQPGPTPPSYAP
jgi:hypothetical protein